MMDIDNLYVKTIYVNQGPILTGIAQGQRTI